MDSPEIIGAVGYGAAMEQISARHRDPLVRILRQGAVDGSFRTATPESDAAMIQDIVMNVSFRRRRELVDENHHIGFTEIIDFVSRARGPDS